jgi:UDP-glucuronate decarboxylase
VRGQGKPEAIEIPEMRPTTRNLAPKVDMKSAEQRLMENHHILAKQSLPTSNTPHVMKTIMLPDHHRKKILITGGAGFVGSHLVDKLMIEGHEVIVVDNFFTGQKKNIAHWLHHPNFRYVWEKLR